MTLSFLKKPLLALSIFLALPAFAASGDDPYWSWFLNDSYSLVTSPQDADAEWWTKAAVTVGGGLFFYGVDEEIREFIGNNHSSAVESVLNVGETFGNGLYILPAMGLTAGYAALYDDSYLLDTMKLSFEAVVLSAAAVQFVKLTLHRHRPNKDDGAYRWDGPDYLDSSNDSFPSGHSAAAFSLATVISKRYGDKNPWVSPIAYGLATLTPLQRMYDDKHWASDVWVASAFGYFLGEALVDYHTDGEGVSVLPVITEDGPMLTLKWTF